jgi:hypothetical protein
MVTSIKVIASGIFGVIVVMLLVSASSPANSSFLTTSAVNLAYVVAIGAIVVAVIGKLIKLI